METYTEWFVQRKDPHNDFWHTLLVEIPQGFALPVSDFGDEAAAVARRDQLRSAHPEETFRAIRSVTTIDEVA